MTQIIDEFAMPATYSRIVARMLGLLERDLSRLLEGTGLPSEILLPGDDTYISGAHQLRVLENGRRILASPDFGLRLGQQLQPSSHGPLGYLALSSPDLMSALQSLRDYQPVRMPIAAFTIDLDSNWLRCTLQMKLAATADVRRVICEGFALIIQSLVESVLGREADDAVIQFEYSKPEYVERYDDYLHAPYHFDCEQSAYLIPAELAHSANSAGDTGAYRLAQELCASLMAQTPHTAQSMSDRVRTLLLAQPQGAVNEDDVARALFVSKRTLVRRLKKENNSYREIKAQVLSDLASRYLLESNQTVDSVAAMLGYYDAAAFRKAFQRQHRMTPREYRVRFRVESGTPARSI
jgi:AraC-like DNA-binding protein